MWMVRAGWKENIVDAFIEVNEKQTLKLKTFSHEPLINKFIENNLVVLNFNLGDLSNKNLDEIREVIREEFPEKRFIIFPVERFCFNMSIGDYVVSYNHFTTSYIVGRILSEYYYSKDLDLNVRDVEWFGNVCKFD